VTKSSLSDTSVAASEQQRALIAALTPAERMSRALALSALAREFAWAGARSFAGESGPDAIRQRFLEQSYGPVTAAWVATCMAAEGLH
jgi:hypothetical protein